MEEKPRILIVDDEADARAMLEALLFREGYELTFAATGPEALARLEEIEPDAILLDVMMPGMDGFEVCRRLRADPLRAEIPVILVTALEDRDSRLRGIEVGADDFVTKPVDRVELRTRVRTITQLNRYRRLLWERTRRHEAEEEILQRNRELTLLNQVITAAASTFETREILLDACVALADALGFPEAAAGVMNEDQTTFADVVTHRRDRAFGDTLAPHPPLVPPHLVPQAPLMASDALDHPLLGPARNQIRDQGLASLLVVPIIVRDSIAGSIELRDAQRREFGARDLTLAESVATAVGQAIENTRLYQELQRYAQSLEETVAHRTWELQVERDRTQAILEALGEAVVVTDVRGTIQYMNPAAVVLTGFEPEEALGQNWHLWQTDTPTTELPAPLQQAVRPGEKWSAETVHKRKDGSLYDAAVTVAPLCQGAPAEEVVGFVSVQRDITPIKQAERLKDQFISNVSHELRTPLSVATLISGNLDTLYDRLSNDKRRRMVRDIREHLGVLGEVIDDVLEISRIDSGRFCLERQPLNLTQLAREEADKQSPLAQRKRLSLCVKGQSLPVRGNEGQLRQVIRNLLNNAIKYTPRGGQITCEALVWPASAGVETQQPGSAQRVPGRPGGDLGTEEPAGTLRAGGWALLRVVDSGIGISQEDLPQVFERFYRVRTESNIPGTGLGLSIARELVELHGGHLAATSTPSEGSTFTVLLPLLQEEVQ
jgi:PAS domain S-box-containing protein